MNHPINKERKPKVVGHVMPRYSHAAPVKRSLVASLLNWLKDIIGSIRKFFIYLFHHPILAGIVCIVVTLLIGLYMWLNRPSQTLTPEVPVASQDTSSSALGPTKGTPKFETLLPQGRTIKGLGGWTRISPPNRNPVYVYTDMITNVPIRVSQQPLPKSLQTNTDAQIKSLASAYKKHDFDGTTVYIGTSSKGPQSVMFTRNNLLIVITSDAVILDDDWKDYINLLDKA